MFHYMYKAFGLIGVAMLLAISFYAVPANAEGDTPGNTAVVTDSHCSGGEGFALVMLTASSQASEPVVFNVSKDGIFYDTETLAHGDSIGVSIGGLSAGPHTITVTADGQQVTVQPSSTVEIVCEVIDIGLPPVIVDPPHQYPHHHKKHKHHKHHKKPGFAALPHVGA